MTTLLNKTTLMFLILISTLVSCSSGTIGEYKKEELPSDLVYSVIKDDSMPTADKNQLGILLSKKLSTGQLATLAEKYYSSKPKRGRFYIFYFLPGMAYGKGAWASSNFNPDLKIEFTGIEPVAEGANKLTPEQQKIADEKAATFDSIVDSAAAESN